MTRGEFIFGDGGSYIVVISAICRFANFGTKQGIRLNVIRVLYQT